MQRIFNLDEALVYMEACTGRPWSETEFFDGFAKSGRSMRAVAPKDSVVVVLDMKEHDLSEGNPYRPLRLKKRFPPGNTLFAAVYPWLVAELWLRGETIASAPADYDVGESELVLFERAVQVTRETVFIMRDELDKFVKREKERDALSALISASSARKDDVTQVVVANEKEAPEKWARGLKLIAWRAALKLSEGGSKVSGPALWEEMVKADSVSVSTNTLRYKAADAKLTQGEAEVKSTTVQRDWVRQLKQLLSTSG